MSSAPIIITGSTMADIQNQITLLGSPNMPVRIDKISMSQDPVGSFNVIIVTG